MYQDNILVLDGDIFTKDPVTVLQSVEKFLQIPSFYTDHHFTYNGEESIYLFLTLFFVPR